MKLRPLHLLILLGVCLLHFNALAQKVTESKVVIGYAGGYRGQLPAGKINPHQVTHINYAFVNVKNRRAVLEYATDSANLVYLCSLKKQNPDLKILISIGGWSWSKGFSDAALSDTSRRAFAQSALQIVEKYRLDGVDIDWEYPAMSGDQGHIYRAEDEHTYTLLLSELRKQLDVLERINGRHLLLTAAVGGFTRFLGHTEMGQAQRYLDYVNLMTYDFYPSGRAVHHTNLYPSRLYEGNSADKVFKEYVKAGVPPGKLVIGIAFYGRTLKLKPSSVKGMNDEVVSAGYGQGYTFIKDSLINQKGFISYRDTDANAPYLYNSDTQEVITYEDEASVAEKCRYALAHHMGGVMFWEFDEDQKGYLLKQIVRSLRPGPSKIN
jgi:chitinase